MKMILIIDDDEKLNALLKEYLKQFGYRVNTAARPDAGFKIFQHEHPDLVILDIMLPGMDGFEVCREIRKTSQVPVIMLTARGEVTDRIVGLEMGADDYLPKPFEPRELAARIQSVFRRSGSRPSQHISMGALQADLEKQTVRLNGQIVELTAMEFELLALFIRNPGKVFTRDQMMDALRGMDWSAFDRSMDMLLSRLRHKLNDDPRHPRWIRTIRGTGYKFIGDDDASSFETS